jgi:hypothetical protein
MEALISKWHRELELFSGVKPMLILEGNVLDQYRYPVAGSLRQDEIVPLSRYLYTYFRDEGYDQIVFYSNLVGFVSPYAPEMLTRYAALTGATVSQGAVQAEFKGNDVLALAAYNAGRGNVRGWMEDYGWSDDFSDVQAIPYKETRAYVKQVLSLQGKYRKLYASE